MQLLSWRLGDMPPLSVNDARTWPHLRRKTGSNICVCRVTMVCFREGGLNKIGIKKKQIGISKTNIVEIKQQKTGFCGN